MDSHLTVIGTVPARQWRRWRQHWLADGGPIASRAATTTAKGATSR